MRSLLGPLVVSVGILTLSVGIGPSLAQGGVREKDSWHLERDSRDQPSLEYRQGDKVIFYVGVGRAVGLWIAYPGRSPRDGHATISIRTSSRRWTMKGELTHDHSFNRGNERATYFLQWDMGPLPRTFPQENCFSALTVKPVTLSGIPARPLGIAGQLIARIVLDG
jgi:hypothetical protein